MASQKATGRPKRYDRTTRRTTNVFSQFNQAQIQEFKEAFDVIDQNRDGIIDKDDLREILISLGKNPTEDYLDGMLEDIPGKLNFTLFLSVFAYHLQGTDPEETIQNAFSCFDDEGKGCIDEERVRELLTTMGNKRLTDVQVDEIFRDIVAKDGQFDYLQFIHAVKNGIIRPASTGKLTQITEGEKTTLHIPANLLETNL